MLTVCAPMSGRGSSKWAPEFRGRQRFRAMPRLIRAREKRNIPIVEPGRGDLPLTYFNVVKLHAGEALTADVPSCEILCVVLSGRADIAACAQEFKNIGRRSDIWSGAADSVYCGTCPRV